MKTETQAVTEVTRVTNPFRGRFEGFKRLGYFGYLGYS